MYSPVLPIDKDFLKMLLMITIQDFQVFPGFTPVQYGRVDNSLRYSGTLAKPDTHTVLV